MKHVVAVVLAVCLGGVWSSFAQTFESPSIEDLAKRYRFFFALDNPDGPKRFLFADVGRHLHAYEVHDGAADLIWSSNTQGSAVVDLIVEDFNGNGKQTILVATAKGRLVGYDALTFNRIYENFLERFDQISAIAAANLDSDPGLEVVILGDEHLKVYDTQSAALEWQSLERYDGSELLIANVDDDVQAEIIINSGFVIDSRFRTVKVMKIEGSHGFGRRMQLIDINGDGFPEVIGEVPGFPLKIYDLWGEREIW